MFTFDFGQRLKEERKSKFILFIAGWCYHRDNEFLSDFELWLRTWLSVHTDRVTKTLHFHPKTENKLGQDAFFVVLNFFAYSILSDKIKTTAKNNAKWFALNLVCIKTKTKKE